MSDTVLWIIILLFFVVLFLFGKWYGIPCPSCKKLRAGKATSRTEQEASYKCIYCGHEWSVTIYPYME